MVLGVANRTDIWKRAGIVANIMNWLYVHEEKVGKQNSIKNALGPMGGRKVQGKNQSNFPQGKNYSDFFLELPLLLSHSIGL